MRSALAALRQGRQGRALRRPTLVPRIAAAACACLLGVAVPPWYARAEDEDTSSQVYLVFDPETGEFVTSHDPNDALPTQTGLESSGTPASAAHSASDNGTDDGAGGDKPMLIAVAAAVVVVGGAGFAFLRSRRRLS